MTLEKFMFGSQGFRAKEATANYKRRIRKLQTDEVRAVRFANLHGNADVEPVVEPEAVELAEVEVTEVTQPEQAEAPAPETPADEAGENADEAADQAGDEDAADEDGEEVADGEAGEPAAEGEPTPKKKAAKAKKKAGK